jgi:hypothetical protein
MEKECRLFHYDTQSRILWCQPSFTSPRYLRCSWPATSSQSESILRWHYFATECIFRIFHDFRTEHPPQASKVRGLRGRHFLVVVLPSDRHQVEVRMLSDPCILLPKPPSAGDLICFRLDGQNASDASKHEFELGDFNQECIDIWHQGRHQIIHMNSTNVHACKLGPLGRTRREPI